MKVFFLIGNHYVHALPYAVIANILKKNGIKTSLYYIGEDIWNDNSDVRFVDIINSSNTKELPIYYLDIGGGFFKKILLFLKLVLNKLSLIHFLRIQKPNLVVFGGDISNINTRLFLDVCKNLKIRTLMVPIVYPGPTVMNVDPHKNIPMAELVRFILRCFKLERTVFFRGWVLGSYHKESVIAIQDKHTRQLLYENGVSLGRLVVVGNLVWDRIHEVLLSPIEDIKAEVFSIIGCEPQSRLVVYCTELLQDFYGMEYFTHIHGLLYDAFNALSEDVKVVIKLHPRETEKIINLYKKTFNGDRYFFIRNIDNYRLMRSSDAVISFYSAMLIDAALLGIPVLSIRIKDDEAPVRFCHVSEFVHITKEEDIQTKTWKILFDKEFIYAAKSFISKWKDSVGIITDGKCSERTADLIKSQILAKG